MFIPKVIFNRYYFGFVMLLCLSAALLTFHEPDRHLVIRKTYKTPPLQNHWLKTAADEKVKAAKVPAAQELKLDRRPFDCKSAAYLNKKTNNINTAYIWTQNNRLKVLTVMSINPRTNKAGILAIPVYTEIASDGRVTTIGSLFDRGGRNKLISNLEKAMDIKIRNYVQIDQSALIKLSDIVGDFNYKGERMNMAAAFEQTASGQRGDDQEIIRTLGFHMVRPAGLLKIPHMFWFATRNIDSNMIGHNFWYFVQIYKKVDFATMKKVAITGRDIEDRGIKVRKVETETWKNIIYELVS